MPNGRSGGFAITRIDLEYLLSSLPPATIVGTSFILLRSVSAVEAIRALNDHPKESVGVEEQDQADYIIHAGGTNTWIVVTPDKPIYSRLRQQHRQWLEGLHGG